MCVFVSSNLITLHRFHFCICNMKMTKSLLDTSGRQKCCLCLCTFCSLASVAGPLGPSAPLIRTWAFPGLAALSSTEEWQVPRVTRMTLPVYCHYTVTSLPNYTNLHQHTQEQALRSEILGQIKGERQKKEALFGEGKQISSEGDRGHVWTWVIGQSERKAGQTDAEHSPTTLSRHLDESWQE